MKIRTVTEDELENLIENATRIYDCNINPEDFTSHKYKIGTKFCNKTFDNFVVEIKDIVFRKYDKFNSSYMYVLFKTCKYGNEYYISAPITEEDYLEYCIMADGNILK